MSVFETFDRKQLRKQIAAKTGEMFRIRPELKESFKSIDQKFWVQIDDTPISYLNPALAKKQGLTDENIDRLRELHCEMTELFEIMKMSDPENPPSETFFSDCVNLIESIEFLMQREWGFTQDANFHSWWFKAPHCNCPMLDNQDRVGSNSRVISQICPLHGQKTKPATDTSAV